MNKSGYTIFWNQGVAEGNMPFSNSKKTTCSNLKDVKVVQTGDFNGDGLADFVTNATDDCNWYFYLNNGNGSFTQKKAATMNNPVACSIYPFSEGEAKFVCNVFDFNHDGKDDIVISYAQYNIWITDSKNLTTQVIKEEELSQELYNNSLNNPNVHVSKFFNQTYTFWMTSDGSTLTKVKTASSNNEDDALNGYYMTGDFNGDGHIDLVNYGYNCYGSTNANSSTPWNIYTNSNANNNSNKIVKVKNGPLGATTYITYSTLCDANVYTKGKNNTYPLVDLQVPLNVVNKVIQSISTDSYTTTYKYSGLRAHLQGRGMLGFTSIVANNSTINEKRTTTINSLNQTYYEPSKVTTTITKGNKTATTETTFDVKNCYEYVKCHFTYPQTIKQTGFYGEVETTTNKYDNSYRLTEQLANYDVANMYRQVKYSSFVKAGGVYMPETVMTTQKHKDDAQTFTTKTTYKYESNGKVAKMVENDSTERPVTHEYSYNKFGNLKTHTVSASDISTVTTTYSYEVTNRFADTVSSSANNLITAYTYNKLGRMTKMQEGLRGSLLTTSYIQDRVGNLLRVTHPDGTTTNYTRSWGNSVFMAFSVTTTTTGQAPVTTWYDNASREVLSSTTGAKGVTFTNSTSYDFINGNVSTQSRSIGSISLTDYYTYDNMGQLTKSVTGTGQTTTFSYSKRSVAASQGNGKFLSKIYDPWGNLTTVSHNQCSSATYKIASNGQPTSINYNDASGQSYTVATMAYDKRGLQSSLTDVDAGKTSYVYDALGRVTKQTDARGNITTNTYNASGLLIKQVCGGVTTTYEYDSNLRLKKETTGSQSISYTYDKYNRLTKKSYSIDGTVLIFSYTYNSNGQMATQTFPDGMIETYTYDANGYLTLITMGGQKVWELKSNTGTQRTVHLGTTPLVLTTSYDFNGLPKSSIMKRGSTTLHSFGYTFDGATGNLKSRTGMQSGTESFTYDAFDRLTTGVGYAVNGNISSKNNVGNYTYDASKKHAVVQVQNSNNLIQGAASLTYTAFNKVATVVQGTNTLTITYGPDRQRTKTVLVNGSATTTTLYADNYEQRTANGTTTSYHYVASPDGLAAVYVKSGSTATAYYIETDHLGSIIRAYDYVGNTKFSAAYDAWGNQTISTNAIGLTRGYCGHEHWNQFGLIDMNGRFYDPLIGRFLSPDPYVQAPDNPQNFNRYSYCLNNPLKYVDPTGYSITELDDEKRRLKRSCNYMQKYEKQGGGNSGYSWGDVINNSFSNITKQLISNMSESWGTLETSTVGHWVTYWYEIRGYNNREVYVIAGEVKVYEIIGNTTTINLPRDRGCSNGDYGSSGGSIASTATTTATNIANIASAGAQTSIFNARHLSDAQKLKYGVNALKGISNWAGYIGAGFTAATAFIEYKTGQANTHTIVDVGVCVAGLGIVLFCPPAALGTAIAVSIYGLSSAGGLGTKIDKATDNWGQKLLYNDEKDY
ncbi:MAG: VCBS repeat-containing protein [Salinivirgaceae bacterium]|nr:VCBS repeat-containing protein [Salinivirgaceae bacterium]